MLHAAMARARKITGPYELDPQISVLTSRDDPELALQKAGHGELVETPAGEWYLAHLASRPVLPERRCMLGRETCLQKAVWSEDGWLRLANGRSNPEMSWPAPAGLKEQRRPAPPERDHFDLATLDVRRNSLRIPVQESWLSLKERPGWLRLRGRDSQHSLFEQSLIARRLQHFRCTIETCLEFSPTHFTHMAGLICYYDTRTHFYLQITHDEAKGKVLGIVLTDDGNYDELKAGDVAINDWKQIHLRTTIDHQRLQFSASPDGKSWRDIGPVLDASKLSDDYGRGFHFTGAMVGLCAQDLSGTRTIADFDYFDYRPAGA